MARKEGGSKFKEGTYRPSTQVGVPGRKNVDDPVGGEGGGESNISIAVGELRRQCGDYDQTAHSEPKVPHD